MRDSLTPKQVAQAIGVSEASLKRWCDRGLLPATRTAGGHRRLPVHGVMQWLRQSGHEVVRPEVLGLPSNTGLSPSTLERSVGLLRTALEAGDEVSSRQGILNLYLAGHSAIEICDQVIAPAFHALGSAWQHGSIEVYQERRGCEICACLLHDLESMLAPPGPAAPYAIGATLADDPYTLPNRLVELVLREAGWRAESYGSCNPGATLAAAIRQRRPGLFWLSVSTIDTESQWLSEYQLVSQAAAEEKVPLAVGGRALTPELRQQMSYSAYCDNLRHLVDFAEAIKR